jgi:co-chaperonin GroES (HSP10)
MEHTTTNTSPQTDNPSLEHYLDPNSNDEIAVIAKNTNIVYTVANKIAVEAVEDKIIVRLDEFKSGYECKTCGGSCIEPPCVCGGTGINRLGGVCKSCNGSPDQYAGKECRACKGVGSTLVLPESAKALPSSGRIVSCGPNCSTRKVGERILFGVHTGYFLPFKGNVRLRIMRETEVLCKIYMVDATEKAMALGDFLTVEEGY